MNISREQFNVAYKNLPLVMREYLAEGTLNEVAVEVGQKYSLHIDTIAAVDRELTSMLLGLETPQQFVGEMRSIGISESAIGPFVQELNEKIFMPLHQKIREANLEPEPITDEDEESEQIIENNLGISSPAVQTPVAQPIQQNPQQAYVPVPLTTPVLAQVPAYVPPTPAFTASHTVPIASAPEVVPISVPTPAPAQVPVFVPVPAEQIGRPPVGFAMSSQPPVAPSSARENLHKILKEYGVDPYREPVDDDTQLV